MVHGLPAFTTTTRARDSEGTKQREGKMTSGNGSHPSENTRSKRDTPATSSRRPDHQKKKPKYKRASFEEHPEEFVSFDVGPDPHTRRKIHKEAIYISCEVFKRAFESKMIEGRSKVYRLEDIDLSTFSLFQQWVYSSRLNLIQTDIDYKASEYLDSSEIAEENLTLAKLWVFGDTYGLPRLQNEVLNMMQRAIDANAEVDMRHYNYIYDNTTQGSLLRDYIVDLIVAEGRYSVFEEDNVLDWSQELLKDLCRAFAHWKYHCGLSNIQRPLRDFYV